MLNYPCTRAFSFLGGNLQRLALGFVVSALFLSGPAKTQQLPDATIVHTILCEAGKVGRELARRKLPLNARVVVDWKEVDTTTGAGGIGASIPRLPIGASGDLSKAREESLKSSGIPFNLHPDNFAACTGYKVDIIQNGIGLYDCLIGKKLPTLEEALKQEEGTASCGSVVTIIKKASGNLRVRVLGADLGPSGSYENKNVVDTAFVAPSYKKKKE
jgi:hypothetical protein